MLRLVPAAAARGELAEEASAAQGQPDPYKSLADDDLMKLAAAGVRTAFQELVRRYHARVLSVCVRSTGTSEEGREIAQEAFVALWQAAPRYRPGGAFPSFLFTIVRNQLRTAARKRATAEATRRALGELPVGPGKQPLGQMLAAENERRLRTALAALDEVHRRALLLRFSGELPYDEIADICDAPVGTVRSWVHHGIKKLRTILGDPS